jgi:hypothetical protein
MSMFVPNGAGFLSPSRRNAYRHHPVFVIDIIPESPSPSSRNAYRLAPDYATWSDNFFSAAANKRLAALPWISFKRA